MRVQAVQLQSRPRSIARSCCRSSAQAWRRWRSSPSCSASPRRRACSASAPAACCSRRAPCRPRRRSRPRCGSRGADRCCALSACARPTTSRWRRAVHQCAAADRARVRDAGHRRDHAGAGDGAHHLGRPRPTVRVRALGVSQRSVPGAAAVAGVRGWGRRGFVPESLRIAAEAESGSRQRW